MTVSVSLQSHPLSLCNTSEDERQEHDFISIVKLESPESNVPQCQPLLDKVRLMGKHTQTHTYEHLLVVHFGFSRILEPESIIMLFFTITFFPCLPLN